MRFGLDIAQQRVPWSEVAARAKFADELGFDGVWGFDHFQPMYGEGPGECFEGNTTLAALTGLTERVRLGLLVTGMTYRHPAVFAAEAITIDHASGGRLELSYGAAWFEDEHRQLGIPFPATKDRIDAFEEAIQIVRGLLTTDDFSFEGKHFSVDHATLNPKPVQQPHPPIWVGRVGREAHHADRGALRRRVALLRRHAPAGGEVGQAQRDGRGGGPRPGRDHAAPRRCRSRTTPTPSPIASTAGPTPASATSCAAGRPAGASRSKPSRALTSEHIDHHDSYGRHDSHGRTSAFEPILDRPRQPASGAGDAPHLPDPAVRPDLLLGGRARPQRRRPLRRRCLRLALPHPLREQLAVQAAVAVRVRVLLVGARRRGEPRRRRHRDHRIALRRHRHQAGSGHGNVQGHRSRPRLRMEPQRGRDRARAAGARGRGPARDRDPRRPRDVTPRREGHHLHPGQPEQRRRPQSGRTRARVDRHRARRRVERRATRPTTSTPARCSRPSRSRPSTTTRTRASR